MIGIQNIRGMNRAKIKALKLGSSGHARAEIRRRYAIAWVEYIDLSRSRPPRSHRRSRRHRYHHCRRRASSSLWISPRHFEPRIQLCLRLWKILVSRPCGPYLKLRFTSIAVPFARHPCGALLSPVLTMSPLLCPDFERIDPRGIYPYPRLWPVDDIMPRDEPSYRRNFFSSTCRRKISVAAATLTHVLHVMASAMICEIANSYRVFHTLLF